MLICIPDEDPYTFANDGEERKKSEVTQSCPTLCDPGDCSPPGSSVHGILQARILEWVAISFSISFSPSPGDLPDPGIEPRSPALQADALSSEPPGKPQWGGGVLNNSASLSRSMFLDLCTWVLARKVKLEEGTVSSPDAGESRLGFVTPSCFPPSLPPFFTSFLPSFLPTHWEPTLCNT